MRVLSSGADPADVPLWRPFDSLSGVCACGKGRGGGGGG
eukprot:COSAG03_NODE_14142_length_475_cov_1.034574_2_plen_38_part_01